MSTVDKLKNIRKVKKDLANKFYIGDDVPLSRYAERISNTDDIKIGIIDEEGKFQPLNGAYKEGDPIEVNEFFEWQVGNNEETENVAVDSEGTTDNKLQNILTSKNAIKEKFTLGDTVLKDYPTSIETGDTAILGYLTDNKSFQDLIFKSNNGSAKNEAVSYNFYDFTALKKVYVLYAWGYNSDGQLGLGYDTAPTNTPTQVGTKTWSQVSCGKRHTLAIDSEGYLWAWGYSRKNPTQVGTKTWSQVSCGERHTLAIDSEGYLWAWGDNSFGQLGLGDNTDRDNPTKVNDKKWLQVACGYMYTVAIDSE